jgi:hypothetical protein
MPRPSVLLCTIVCSVVLSAACSEPPQREINSAQTAIDAARAAGAEQYAAESFAAATTALQQSHEAVAQRDYRLALSRAVDATDRAQDAARLAAEGKARARADAEAAVNSSNAALQQLEARLRAAEAARVPARELAEPRKTAKDAVAVLQKARASLNVGNYAEATEVVKGLQQQIRMQIADVEQATAPRLPRRSPRRR